MNVTNLVLTAQSEGVILSPSDSGAIKYEGDPAAVNRWLPAIKEHKAEILEALEGRTEPFDREALAWIEDDRRRCAHCLNLLADGVCKVAIPGGPVSARQGYKPNPAILQRCAGYRPCPDDPDRRPGRERWPEFGNP
jgi:hypothetical protein